MVQPVGVQERDERPRPLGPIARQRGIQNRRHMRGARFQLKGFQPLDRRRDEGGTVESRQMTREMLANRLDQVWREEVLERFHPTRLTHNP